MVFARPWALALGAAFAAGVVLLHMLRPHPGPRTPLPTARFLAPDRRTRLRVSRPADALLLATRLAVVGALSLAAAAPSLEARREGGLRLVALDAGRGMGGAWDAALDSARALLAAAPALLVVFDTAAMVAGPDALDSLAAAGPSRVDSDYAAAFRGLRGAARGSRASTFEASILTMPRGSAWGPGLTSTRAAAWPAEARVIDPSGDAAPGREPERGRAPPLGPARVLGAAAADPYLRSALTALGYTPEAGEAGRDAGPLLVGPDAALPTETGEAPVTVLWGDRVGPELDLLWTRPSPAPSPPAAASATLFATAGARPGEYPATIQGAVGRAAGGPAQGAEVWAVDADGRPLGVARRREGGCAAYFAGDLLAPALVGSERYPLLLERALGACALPTARPDALDERLGAGAVGVLSGATGSPPATAASLGLGDRRSLQRPLLAAGLVLGLLETLLATALGRARSSALSATSLGRERAA